MYFALAIVIIASLLNLLLATIIFVRNPKGALNRSFGLFAIAITLWSTFNYLADSATTNNLLFTRLTFAWGALLTLSVYFLCRSIKDRRNYFDRSMLLQVVLASLVVIASMSPLVVEGVKLQPEGVTLEVGVGYYFYIAFIVQAFAVVSWHFASVYKKSDESTRAQVKLLAAGVTIYAVLAITSNLILPLLIDNWVSSRFGPIFSLIFVAFTAYAIVKHRFLDIRSLVARSVGFILSLGVIALLYGIFVTSVSDLIFDVNISNQAKIFFALTTTIAALLYQPFKRVFSKLTNRIFFQDAYDPQELFDRLNKMLVSSLDVKYLMMQSISIIETALKPDFIVVGLRDGELRQRLFASRKVEFSPEDIKQVRKLTPHVHQKVIVTDYLDNSKNAELKNLLKKSNIAILVRLAQNVRISDDGLGYLVLGAKKTGNPYTHQDIRVLDTVANELIIAVQNALHYEEIQKFNLVLQAKVDDATRKMRNTNEKLRALDETKDDFISMASHQLRTPLTSVKGYLSMVLEGDAGKINATQKKMLGQAYVSSQRMVYLIADLLNVSRLKTGKFEIQAAPTNLAHMVSEEIDQLVETAAAREIELSYDQPLEFPDLMLDETKTRQVIMNFVDNAIYYTQSGGHIKVELADTPTSIELKVIDDGIGVPKAEQPHLFTKFYRAGNARKARPDGTGLGLYMAKKVVLAQGGSILFESKEGKGSTFGFLFPKSLTKHVPKLPVVDNATETVTK